MITLHSDLPMPDRAPGRTPKYPLADLKEGQCFVVTEIINTKRAVARVAAAVGAYRRSLGQGAPKFSVRVFQQDGKDAVGVWRV